MQKKAGPVEIESAGPAFFYKDSWQNRVPLFNRGIPDSVSL